MNRFQKLWKQLWCLHYYDKGEPIRAGWPWGIEYKYTCQICDKKVIMMNDFPINVAPNPIYDKKDLRYNLSPPNIIIEDKDRW